MANSPVTSKFTVLAMRLDDPAGLFALYGATRHQAQIKSMRDILFAHDDVIRLVKREAREAVKMFAVIESAERARIEKDAPRNRSVEAQGEALDALRLRWLIAAFDTEQDAIRVAIAIQERTRQSLTTKNPARLQCAIAVSQEDEPLGMTALLAPLTRKRETAPSDIRAELAIALLRDAPVLGGQIVCSRRVYDAIRGASIHDFYGWRAIRSETRPEQAVQKTPGPISSYLWAELKRTWRAISRTVRGEAEPMECLYATAQVLLEAPFERVFAAEIAGWIRGRRLQPGYETQLAKLRLDRRTPLHKKRRRRSLSKKD